MKFGCTRTHGRTYGIDYESILFYFVRQRFIDYRGWYLYLPYCIKLCIPNYGLHAESISLKSNIGIIQLKDRRETLIKDLLRSVLQAQPIDHDEEMSQTICFVDTREIPGKLTEWRGGKPAVHNRSSGVKTCKHYVGLSHRK